MRLNIHILSFAFLLVLVHFISSCSLTKRRYMRGFFIEHLHAEKTITGKILPGQRTTENQRTLVKSMKTEVTSIGNKTEIIAEQKILTPKLSDIAASKAQYKKKRYCKQLLLTKTQRRKPVVLPVIKSVTTKNTNSPKGRSGFLDADLLNLLLAMLFPPLIFFVLGAGDVKVILLGVLALLLWAAGIFCLFYFIPILWLSWVLLVVWEFISFCLALIICLSVV